MLPALVVMLIVIAYPIYYTIELLLQNAADLQLKDKIFVGLDNYVAHPDQRVVLATSRSTR